ncbi:DUF1206 domain-containing protein [Oleiharenicola lentus]|uniref:DUF1206 domain-containing protein n=1 Tax=Oleiharenicola lentus TaxID=2508720 RepID=UPI003F677C88
MPTKISKSVQKIRPWISFVARAGFAAKGTIYFVIGLLALRLALGFGGSAEDMHGAVEKIGNQPFGKVALLLLAFGLLNYGVWNAVQCIWDPERVAKDWIGRALRFGFGFGAGLNFFLAYKTAGVGLGRTWGGESGDEAVKSWTELVLSWPGGRMLILVAAAVTVGVAVSMIVRLIRGRFMDVFSDNDGKDTSGLWLKTTARFGFVAQAIVAGLIAWFLWRAGLHADPAEAGGFPKALETLLQQPYGRWLLGLTAVGVMSRGLFIWLMVPYREIRVKKAVVGLPARWRRMFGF